MTIRTIYVPGKTASVTTKPANVLYAPIEMTTRTTYGPDKTANVIPETENVPDAPTKMTVHSHDVLNKTNDVPVALKPMVF
ncbi:MAG: hypothetical protein GTN82_24665 [Candidatus Aminicenantes bacterium]|nr:hypothetical protein [Candidatus Aminicenantes bacterium]